MIDASFGDGRGASFAGAYQYDTGQRLRLHGLPSPEAFSAEDDFLSGDLAAVEVHFSRMGDSQSEMRLGVWDAARSVWTAAVPDEYLSVSEPVHVHVYVYHGESGGVVRAKTMYEGVFTPIERAAPFGLTTPDQDAQWQEKEIEIDVALAAAQKAEAGALAVVKNTHGAAQEALEPAQQALQAAQDAKEQKKLLQTTGGLFGAAGITVQTLSPGAKATVSLTRNERGAPVFAFGIPRGADGAPGETGDKGPADVEFYMDGTTLIVNTTN